MQVIQECLKWIREYGALLCALATLYAARVALYNASEQKKKNTAEKIATQKIYEALQNSAESITIVVFSAEDLLVCEILSKSKWINFSSWPVPSLLGQKVNFDFNNQFKEAKQLAKLSSVGIMVWRPNLTKYWNKMLRPIISAIQKRKFRKLSKLDG